MTDGNPPAPAGTPKRVDRALVVGRFQPLHDGHVALIRTALAQARTVVVAIGSSTEPVSARNPYTFDLRKRMVEAVFGPAVDEGRLMVVGVPDLHDPPNWVAHCLAHTGAVDVVFGNDDSTLALFEPHGIEVRRTGLVDRDRLEGRRIRADGDMTGVPTAARRLLAQAVVV